jgi:hypothetical protein
MPAHLLRWSDTCRFDWPTFSLEEQVNAHQSLHSTDGIATVTRLKKLMKTSLDYRMFTEFCGPNQNIVLDPYVSREPEAARGE